MIRMILTKKWRHSILNQIAQRITITRHYYKTLIRYLKPITCQCCLHRNQSIDLPSKSIDWFLYEGNTDTYRVNKTVKSLTSPLRNVFSLSASSSLTFKISFSTTKSLSHIMPELRTIIIKVWFSVYTFGVKI